MFSNLMCLYHSQSGSMEDPCPLHSVIDKDLSRVVVKELVALTVCDYLYLSENFAEFQGQSL